MSLFKRKKHYPPMSVHEIQRMLIEKLAIVLRPHGFKHSGSTFYRMKGELVHIINLQASQWNQGDEATYYVNLAVYYGPAFEIEHGNPMPAVPKEYDGHLRCRLGGKGVPADWKFSSKVDNAALADKLINAITTQGLTYFGDIDTPSQLASYIMDRKKDDTITVAGHISKAIILSLLGDKKQAQTELDTYFKKNDRLNNNAPITKLLKRQYLCVARKAGLQLDFPELGGETCVGFYVAMKGKHLVNEERRTRDKLELFLHNLEKKGLGYLHHYGRLRKPGTYRIGFCTKDPSYVAQYITDRKDKFASPLQAIVANDEF
jgi:hypothetical protein